MVYWFLPRKYPFIKKIFLIITSYLIYMNWKPAYAILLAGITIITYSFARLLELHYKREKYIAILGCILTVLPLLIYKYYNFINDSIFFMLQEVGLRFHLPGLNVAIPVGISFFTFQALGYFIDVYQKKIKAEKNFLDYTLFVSFFPQITSGPISKASDLIPQIKRISFLEPQLTINGFKWFIWGLFLKTVVADRLGLYVDTVYANYEYYSSITCFIISLFYSIQIYCDFAGYSYMAMGVANMLGFKIINNFNRPYLATSITSFWKRWHISLTKWLTNYIYIPLGGNRCSKLRQYHNIMMTFIVSGLWHGANWTFIIWGMIHGIFQIIEKSLGISNKNYIDNNKKFNHNIKSFAHTIITFYIVNIAWIFFRMPTISDAINYIYRIHSFTSGKSFIDNNNNLLMTVIAILAVLLKDLLGEFTNINIMRSSNSLIRWSTYLILLFSIILFGVLDAGQFIYVSF